MDKGAVNRKQASKPNGLMRSTINKDFAIASNTVKGFRHSSIEPSSSRSNSSYSSGISGISSDIFGSRYSAEIHPQNSNDFYRNTSNCVNYNERNRQTVYIDCPTKLYAKGRGGVSNDIFSTVNDSNNKYSANVKSKWTQKKRINGNNSV